MRQYFHVLWLAIKGDIELLEKKFRIPNKAWGAVPRQYVGKIRRLLSEAAETQATQQHLRKAQVPTIRPGEVL
jgi:hypothetical protein